MEDKYEVHLPWNWIFEYFFLQIALNQEQMEKIVFENDLICERKYPGQATSSAPFWWIHVHTNRSMYGLIFLICAEYTIELLKSINQFESI